MSLTQRSIQKVLRKFLVDPATPSVVLECLPDAEMLIASLVVEGYPMHGRVPFMLFECSFAAKRLIAGLAAEGFLMHG
jgi:hypothetical protein